jgi:formamidopyrimidine-DNA glycosylase
MLSNDSDRAELLFYDTRKFGRIRLVEAAEVDEIERRLGLEPLDPAFTPDALEAILRRRARRMKPLLLDQSVIAGLGNIYVDESLFRAGIHPLVLSRDVPIDHSRALHAAITDVLTTAVELHGTTLRDYRTGTGEPGGNQGRLRIYGLKPGTPCPGCGTPLERLVVTQRGTIFCPYCQPLLSPDRRDR